MAMNEITIFLEEFAMATVPTDKDLTLVVAIAHYHQFPKCHNP